MDVPPPAPCSFRLREVGARKTATQPEALQIVDLSQIEAVEFVEGDAARIIIEICATTVQLAREHMEASQDFRFPAAAVLLASLAACAAPGDDAQDARDNTGIMQANIQDGGQPYRIPWKAEARGAQNLNPNRTPPARQPFLTRTTAA